MTSHDMTIADRPAQAAETPPPAPTLEEDEKKRRRRLLLLLLLSVLLIVFLAFTTWYLLFRKPISEIIPPSDNFAMPAFTTAMYEVSQPIGIAVSPDGTRIYVTQGAGTQETLVLDQQGGKLGVLAPAADGTRFTQMFVAVDGGTGTVYASDRTAGVVRRYAGDGTYLGLLEPPPGVVGWQPMAVAVDRDGNVLVADVSAPFARIRQFSRDGTFVRDFGVAGDLDHPNGLAVDSHGDLYVASTGNGKLVVYGPDGAKRATVAPGSGLESLGLPRGVAIDDKDRVYVADSTGQRVLVFRALKEGATRLEFVDSFGSEGTVDGRFAFPNGIAADSRSRLYIADWNNDRIQLWSY